MQLAGKHVMLLLTVEATQVTGVLFTLLAEMLIKGTKWPGTFASLGFVLMFSSLGVYIWLSYQSLDHKKDKPGQPLSFHDLPAGVYQYGSQED